MIGSIEMAREHVNQAAELLQRAAEEIRREIPLKAEPAQTALPAIDGIAFTNFQQEGKIDWRYEIAAKSGKQYLVTYSVENFGFAVERMFSKKKDQNELIFERDIKVGFNYKPTYEEVINNGGVLDGLI